MSAKLRFYNKTKKSATAQIAVALLFCLLKKAFAFLVFACLSVAPSGSIPLAFVAPVIALVDASACLVATYHDGGERLFDIKCYYLRSGAHICLFHCYLMNWLNCVDE